MMAVLCIKEITKFLYTKNKWHKEIMEKSWVNFVKCLLDRLYKLCLTYLYFFGIYFNVEFFFRILGGRTSLISSNQNLFLSNIIFLFITCFTLQHLQRKVCFSRTINFLLLQQLFLLSNRLFLFENEYFKFFVKQC